MKIFAGLRGWEFNLVEYLDMLKEVALFQGIRTEELLPMLSSIGAKKKHFKKNQIIFSTGDHITKIGIILSGSIQVMKEDFLGNRMILSDFSEGDLFAEVFSCAKIDKIPVTVIANIDTTILFLDYQTLMLKDSFTFSSHIRLIENMISILAVKNMLLNNKIEILSKRTTRDKLIAFFQNEIRKQDSFDFSTAFDRQQLADYLCVDRSAMSKELCKMRDEGIVSFKKNRFQIRKPLEQYGH